METMIRRWDIITIGNLSRNRYWGESEDRAYRPPLCTCTLITADGFRLLVDPSIQDGPKMLFELERRVGLKPQQVDLVFITHSHGDHHFGLKHFPDARWVAAPGVADAINASKQYAKQVEPEEGVISDLVEIIPTPGHTLDHHSLRFDCEDLSIVIAGDAVMTRDFWKDRRGFFNSADIKLAVQTMEDLAGIADVIVPGHDNFFLDQGEE